MTSAKDYEQIARVLNTEMLMVESMDSKSLASASYNTLVGITYGLCSVFAQDNPRFNRDRFVRAALGENNVPRM